MKKLWLIMAMSLPLFAQAAPKFSCEKLRNDGLTLISHSEHCIRDEEPASSSYILMSLFAGEFLYEQQGCMEKVDDAQMQKWDKQHPSAALGDVYQKDSPTRQAYCAKHSDHAKQVYFEYQPLFIKTLQKPEFADVIFTPLSK